MLVPMRCGRSSARRVMRKQGHARPRALARDVRNQSARDTLFVVVPRDCSGTCDESSDGYGHGLRHGAWDAGVALLAHGATRAGMAATHGHEHGCRRSSRAGLLMNGASQQLTRAQGDALHERTAKKQSTAAQPRTGCGTTSCAATPADSCDCIGGAILCYGVGLIYRSGLGSVSRAGRCVEGRLPC